MSVFKNLFIIFFLYSELFEEFGYFALDLYSHGDDRMVLDVGDFELFNRYDYSEVGFEELLINLENIIFFIKFQVLK